LRKVKTLGLRKNFRVIRPGDLGSLPPRTVLLMEEAPPPPPEEEEQEETSEYPPFEPLVLWSHAEDSRKKIEVCCLRCSWSCALGDPSAGLSPQTASTGRGPISL
jgi:hypothetical protein